VDEVLAVGVAEAARRIGVCPRTVTNLIQAKELVSRKIGRRRVIPVSALLAFLRHDHDLAPVQAKR
jgi:excisionase family DNA binding protein